MHECFSAVDGDSWFDSALSNSRRRHKPQSYFIDQQRHPERYSAVHGNIQLDVSCNQLSTSNHRCFATQIKEYDPKEEARNNQRNRKTNKQNKQKKRQRKKRNCGRRNKRKDSNEGEVIVAK